MVANELCTAESGEVISSPRTSPHLYKALDTLWHDVAGAIFQVSHKYVCTSDLTANVSRERDLASELLYFTQLQRMPDCIHNCSREPGVTATKT